MEIVAPAIESPRRTYSVVSSSTSMTALAGDVTAIVGGLANRRSCTPRYAANARTATVRRAKTTRPGEKVRPLRGVDDGARHRDDGLRLAVGAALAPPLEQDVVRIEAEIQRVVAQEALGVDGTRQLAVVATLEGGEVARPDLRVPFRAVEVDALALPCRQESLGKAGRRLAREAAVTGSVALSALAPFRADRSPDLIPCRHRASPSSSPYPSAPSSLSSGADASRRRTTRAFDPSNAPM